MKKKDPNENIHQLGNLLLKYKSLLKPPQASVEKECIAVIAHVTGIALLPHQVSYTVSTKTLLLKAPSLLRSELMMRRGDILEECKRRLGEKGCPQTIL